MKPCNGCGKCCSYGGKGNLGPIEQSQIDIWSKTKPELLQHTRKETDGTYRVWINPATGDFYEQCPWLIAGDARYKYHCAIQDIKPKACTNYPMSVLQMLRDDCEIWDESDKTNALSFEERELKLYELKNQ